MALGVQDLGQLYYRPIKDRESTVVLSTVKFVSDPKALNSLSVRWLPLTKILRKLPCTITSDFGETPHVSELLLSSLQDMISYNQVSTTPLPRGLYLGYVKLKSSVDIIRVLVPHKTPNVIPFYRIRENSHVSREEWEWLKAQEFEESTAAPSTVQLKFQKAISLATRNLFSYYDIPFEELGSHRLYDVDVIELSPNVSFLLILPPVENICAIPGQYDSLTSRVDCIPLPIQVFEILHMTTYRYNFIACYSRLSSILEMDTLMAQHAQRKAFSSHEVISAKERLSQLQVFQTQVDNIWRELRWIMDVLTFARDKHVNGGIPFSRIYLYQKDSPSPQNSPHQSPVQERTNSQYERQISKDETTPRYSLRITMSSSSFSIPEPRGSDVTEIRRTHSTSKLLHSSSECEGMDLIQNETTVFGPKARSSDSLRVSFNIGHTENTKESGITDSSGIELSSNETLQCQNEAILPWENKSNIKVYVNELESSKRGSRTSFHQLLSARAQRKHVPNNSLKNFSFFGEVTAQDVQEHARKNKQVNSSKKEETLYTSMSETSFFSFLNTHRDSSSD